MIYPTKIEAVEIDKLNEEDVAKDLILQLENGLTLAQAIGSVLNCSDDVQTFNVVAKKIDKATKDMRNVRIDKKVIDTESVLGEYGEEGIVITEPVKEVSHLQDKTESEFKADLESVSYYIDSVKFYNGLKAEKNATTWASYKGSFREDI